MGCQTTGGYDNDDCVQVKWTEGNFTLPWEWEKNVEVSNHDRNYKHETFYKH